MTTFHLIRHGERDTPDGILAGVALGVHLTERGRAQAEAIARRLASEPLDQVFSSPQERALETAAPLARARQLEVQTTVALSEIDFGAWTRKAVVELDGEVRWRNFNQFRSGTRIPSGESALQVQARFVGELLRWRDTFPGQHIACFSHADPIRIALGYFLGIPIDFFARFEIACGSISTLELAEWGVRILRVNAVATE
jgi:broad specificity phosphatase PhoE